MLNKLNFKSVVSIVIGSQIGSGVFLLPATLALLGPISLFGWLISGTGAVLLALVFAQLCLRCPEGSGGPHVYVEKAFGRKVAFFVAWTYWLVSWVSSIAVIVAAVSYLSQIWGGASPTLALFLEILLLVSVTVLNIRGASAAGVTEIILTVLKCIPLILIPLACFFFFNPAHFYLQAAEGSNTSNTLGILNTASLMTLWGFIGLESATTTASIVDNPRKTLPRAVIVGTLIVAVIYALNSIGIMGVVPPSTLATSQAPYVTASEMIFSTGWNIVIAVIAFLACLGTLNAWVLTSGQMGRSAASEGLFPKSFGKTNKKNAPYVSLLIALICSIPLLIFTANKNLVTQVNVVIDLSVVTFLFIYLACTLGFLKILRKTQSSWLHYTVGTLALIFCVWALLFISWKSLVFCSLFVLSGVPIYLWQYRKIAEPKSLAQQAE